MRYRVEYEFIDGTKANLHCIDAYRIGNIIFIKISNKREIEINFDNLKYWKRFELEEI